MEKRRVVVTGLGAVSPVGNSAEASWASVKNGVSGIAPITLFDAKNRLVKIAGEVKGFNVEDYGIDRHAVRKMARFTQLVLASCMQAIKDSGLSLDKLQKEKNSIIIGNSLSGLDAIDDGYRKFFDSSNGSSRMSPLTTPLSISSEAAANVSIYFGLHGPALSINTACASGTDSLGLALDMIRNERADIVIAGGTESAITEFNIASLTQLQALCTTGNDEPEKASRPFDKSRTGFVLSEGSAVLILEEYEHAKSRGAKIYAEFAGYGSSCDSYNITAPLKDGSIASLAVTQAIKEAGCNPCDIDYYNAHGTSTVSNDSAESKMIKNVFSDYAYDLSISSTKSMTGHLVGAAGAIEALFCVKAIEEGFVPPTINLLNPDIERGCDLNYTPNKGVKKEIKVAASASMGFGGHNGCVVFKKI